jgi:Tfp pilus assembly protein PilX
VLALALGFTMAVLGMTLCQVAITSDREVNGQVDDRRAFCLAEAGLAEAMTALRAGASGNVGNQGTPAYLSGGVFWVEATQLNATNTRLVSTALAGSGRAALEVVIEKANQAPLFQTVINSDDILTLNANVVVDSFDSELGSYASQAINNAQGYSYAKPNGDVSSNQDIILNAGATVFGDATPGPGETVSFATGSYVSGSTAAAQNPFVFPPIQIPSAPSTGPYTVAPGASVTLGSGTHSFDNFTISKAGKLKIVGPATVIVNDFYGGKDGRLLIDATAGPVTFYVKGNYSHLNNFEAQPVGSSPMAVAFMVDGPGDVVFPSNTKVRGAYYVPHANVLFANYCEAWGAFAARRIDMASAMRFHYDETLAKHWSGNTGQGKDPLRLLAWQPQAVTPTALLRDRRDPFRVLGVKPAALPSPANAWDI